MKVDRKLLWIAAGLLGTLVVLGILIGVAMALLRGRAARPAEATIPPQQIATWAAATLAALQSPAAPTPTGAAPSPTPLGATPPPASPPPTAAASPTPIPSATPVPSPTPPCLAASFVQDVTVPDGTEFAPGETFTKTWRLRNVGSCTWTVAFTAFFDQGDRLDAPVDVSLPHAVEPGETVDIAVEMRAPADPGTYKGYWKLRSDRGEAFGIGSDHNQAFWVEIRVVATPTPTPTPAPAETTITIPHDPANSGTLYADGDDTIGGSVMAGDTSNDVQARAYFTFDISAVSGTVLNAQLTLSGCRVMGDPFGPMGGLWLGEVEFALPLRTVHYNIPSTPITHLTAPPAGSYDVTSQVQADVTAGDPYFQIRLHPMGRDDDGAADYLMCSSATLQVTYRP